MVFPVVMYGCESWTIKKAERQRTDAFELWCWRRLLRVPWTARRSNQSILKEISPGCSLEGLMLKLKLRDQGPRRGRESTWWWGPGGPQVRLTIALLQSPFPLMNSLHPFQNNSNCTWTHLRKHISALSTAHPALGLQGRESSADSPGVNYLLVSGSLPQKQGRSAPARGYLWCLPRAWCCFELQLHTNNCAIRHT